MAKKATPKEEKGTVLKSTKEKLIDLKQLQDIYSKIDRIKTLRGELPLEVQDLEDEIAGMETRLANLEKDVKRGSEQAAAEKAKVANAQMLIEKYKDQLERVKNNREYDNLSKEIEFQGLEIELSQKCLGEQTKEQSERKERIATLKVNIEELKKDHKEKAEELDQIKSETKQEEECLRLEAKELEARIEERLLKAFHRIREGARNGLAVVAIEREACGGCFNKLPDQRQIDVKQHRQIYTCEYCGRIMVDPNLGDQE